ncbi:MAG TPA: sensor histidine kinase N-terminal domain-containing protein [Rhodocyclaceae bacterium]
MHSLRRRVALWLLPPLLVLLAVNAYFSYSGALTAANLAYDRSLAASIKSIGERSYARNGEVVVDIPYSALEIFSEGAQEDVFYAVFGPNDKLITGYPDLRPPQLPQGDGVLKVGDAVFKGQAVRVGAMRKRLYDASIAGGDAALLLVVAETTESRTGLALELFYGSFTRQLVLVILGVVLVFAAVSTAFRPLLRLRDTLEQRAAEDLTPIAGGEVPSEVRPLIDAINRHMGRLAYMVEARKRFVADAAHQLRTPLAVLGTQADYGLRQQNPEEMHKSMQGLSRSIAELKRLTEQMLALSRVEAAGGLVLEKNRLDLAPLVRAAALDLAPLALAKQIDLAYEGADDGLWLAGNGPLLQEMAANLIDNAIRYSPAGGRVVVAADHDGSALLLRVSDEGPGIPAAEREQVFKRFYRLLGQGDESGSGLGLSIVKEICLAHGGSISLDDADGGRGLCVRVRLPALVGATA